MNIRKTTKIRSHGTHMNRKFVSSVFESLRLVPFLSRRSKARSSFLAPLAVSFASTWPMSPTSSTSSHTVPETGGR